MPPEDPPNSFSAHLLIRTVELIIEAPGVAARTAKTALSQVDEEALAGDPVVEGLLRALRVQAGLTSRNPTEAELAHMETATRRLSKRTEPTSKRELKAKPEPSTKLSPKLMAKLFEQRRFDVDHVRLLQPEQLPTTIKANKKSLQVLEAAVHDLLLPVPHVESLNHVIDAMPVAAELPTQVSGAARRQWTAVRGYLSMGAALAENGGGDAAGMPHIAQKAFESLTNLKVELGHIKSPDSTRGLA